MVELIPLALVGLLCWYWWNQGKRIHRERREREEREERAAGEKQGVDQP